MVAAALVVLAFSQTVHGNTPMPHEALARWRAQHGPAWQATIDPETGYGRFLHGGGLDPAPAPASDAELAERARAILAATRDLHGIDVETLGEPATTFLPLGLAGTTDKISVEFRQHVGGVPVAQGFANVLFDAGGSLLSVDTTGLPDLRGFATTPAVAAEEAVARALELFDASAGLPVTSLGAPELAIEQVLRSGTRRPVLAWRVDVLAGLAGAEPVGTRYAIDALDGALVRSEPLVHHFDVSGRVRSMASPGDRPDVPANPEEPENMRRIQVVSAFGTVLTDVNGDFTIPGATEPVSVTVTYTGPNCDVNNAAGGDHATTALLTMPSGNDVLMNPLSDQPTTAQANAFNWVNRLRDWTRGTNPNDTISEFQAIANVNLPGPCNAAFVSGPVSSVNFFIENLCVNSAYSSVVAHEMGHWYNVRYGSGNGGDGFGEGNADVYAMYMLDTNVVGRDFFGTGQHIRNGNNTRQFCGDCCGGCYGEVHDDGEVLMGALWKVRARLKATHGTVQGGLIADELFNAWMNAFNDAQIRTIIETHWLVLDDNDGNIFNGTPHYADIDPAFRQQGFPGVNVQSCPPPSSFCQTSPNSVGPGATMAFAGTTSVSANNFALVADECPPGTNGIFYYGATETLQPFGNGFRCIGGTVFRLGIQPTSEFGQAYRPLDLNSLPPGGAIQSGDVRLFQFWYRNPAGGGAGFNLSNGLRATFCP